MKSRYLIIKEYKNWIKPPECVIVNSEYYDENINKKISLALRRVKIRNAGEFLIVFFIGSSFHLYFIKGGIKRYTEIMEHPINTLISKEFDIVKKEFKKWMRNKRH